MYGLYPEIRESGTISCLFLWALCPKVGLRPLQALTSLWWAPLTPAVPQRMATKSGTGHAEESDWKETDLGDRLWSEVRSSKASGWEKRRVKSGWIWGFCESRRPSRWRCPGGTSLNGGPEEESRVERGSWALSDVKRQAAHGPNLANRCHLVCTINVLKKDISSTLKSGGFHLTKVTFLASFQ